MTAVRLRGEDADPLTFSLPEENTIAGIQRGAIETGTSGNGDGTVAKTALFIAILAGFMTPFDFSAVNIALPAIGAQFSMDAVSLSWVSTAYLLASAMFLVPFGRIADIYGRKKVFTAGLAIFTGASLALVFSPSSAWIILLRFIQGTGSALIYGTAVAILTSVTRPSERGKAIGIYTTSVYVGLSLGPFIGGLLTGYFGWESIFLVNVPIGIFTIGLISSRLHGEWAESRGERFDYPGAVMYALMIVTIMYGFSFLPAPFAYLIVLSGILILSAFIVWELRSESPLLNIRIFLKNRVFAFSNLAAFINYSATFAVTFFLSLYLQYIKGFSPQYAGLILISQPVVMALVSSISGRLADRYDPGRLASFGMALSAVSLLMLVLVTETTSLAYLVASLVILGLGLAFFSSPNTTAIMNSVEKRSYGIASGMVGTMRLTGQMFSMGVAVIILAVFIGKEVITPAVFPGFLAGMKLAFLIFAVLCIAGIFFSLVRGRTARDGRAP
jgi:EmrB/QacA subfamily drug resistance transporter